MTEIVKPSGTAALLGTIPALLGYTPTNSIVLLAMKGSRSLGAMRFDLPEDDEVDEVIEVMVGHVVRIEGITGVISVVYGASTPLSLVINAAIWWRTDLVGLEHLEAMFVNDEGWGGRADTSPRPMSEVEPYQGPTKVNDFDQKGPGLPEIDEQARAELLAAIETVDADDFTGDNPYRVIQAVVDGEASVNERAAVHVWLTKPSLRDISLAYIFGGTDFADVRLVAQIEWEESGEYPASAGEFMIGIGEDRPDPKVLARAIEAFEILYVAKPDASIAGAIAWLQWALGHSTIAAIWGERGVEEVEGNSGLAEIVGQFVTAGHLPQWAFQPVTGN